MYFRYDLLCQSTGSRPPAIVTWFRDSERLESTTETVSVTLVYFLFSPTLYHQILMMNECTLSL